MRNPRVGLRRDENRYHRSASRFYNARNVEVTANEGAFHRSSAMTIDPDLGTVVDAAEMKPGVIAFVEFRYHPRGAIPVWSLIERLRDVTHVFPVQRFRINTVVHECGEHSSRYGSGIPVIRMESRGRDHLAGVGDLARLLHLPATNGLAG